MSHDVTNEPRDEHGKWTASAASAALNTDDTKPYIALADVTPSNVERAKTIASLAEKSAKALGYTPNKINVTDKDHVFTLNGKEMKAAGTAMLDTGVINLHANQIQSNADVPSVMAHEVMHQKFQTFINDHQAERAAMEKDPDYHKETRWVTFDAANPLHVAMQKDAKKYSGSVISTAGQIREPGFMRPDGLLNEPYASKYPTYQAFTAAHMPGSSDFAKTDGVSGYSREWWDAWHGKTANTGQAMHETLAEIARLKFEGNPVQHVITKKDGLKTIRKTPDPNWTKLYKAVEDHWKKRAKK